jgi:hypothetical protein
MVRLAAGADVAVLDLDEIADVHVAVEHGPGRSRANGPITQFSPDARLSMIELAWNLGVRTDLGIADDAIRPDLHARAQTDLARAARH